MEEKTDSYCKKWRNIKLCLYEWFLERCKQHVTLVFRCYARKQKYLPSYKPNTGWLQRFKNRHQIVKYRIAGERADEDLGKASKWIDVILLRLVADFDNSCIYNADETGLFYRMTSDYTLDTHGATPHGGNEETWKRVWNFLYSKGSFIWSHVHLVAIHLVAYLFGRKFSSRAKIYQAL